MAKDTGSQQSKAEPKSGSTKATKDKATSDRPDATGGARGGAVAGQKAKSAATDTTSGPSSKPKSAGKKQAGSDKSSQAAEASSSKADTASADGTLPRLQQRYRTEIVKAMMADFSYGNANEVPRISKVVINFGLGEAVLNPNIVKTAVAELTVIAGQQPVVTRAKKAIANFKLRAGLPIGCMVTLRRNRMWEFLDRLLNVAMPRIRDFKGVSSKAFDGRGNYSMGLREQIVFPEIDYDKVEKIKGFNVTITTTANTDEEGRALLRHLGMPFRN